MLPKGSRRRVVIASSLATSHVVWFCRLIFAAYGSVTSVPMYVSLLCGAREMNKPASPLAVTVVIPTEMISFCLITKLRTLYRHPIIQ
jgi:Kef-type K+ transport system membrane component KefB